MSHQRLYAQRDRLEDEIRRLESSLKIKCNELSIISRSNIDEDLEMVKRMREILLVLRQEHQEIMNSIDRALETVSRRCERPPEPWLTRPPTSDSYQSQPLSSGSDLDQLVKRVQQAIGDDPPRSPEFKRYFSTYSPIHDARSNIHASPGDTIDSPGSELSVASKQYLEKYGLLGASPTRNRARNQFREPYKPTNPSKLFYGHVHEDYSPPLRPRQKQIRRDDDENIDNRILPRFQ